MPIYLIYLFVTLSALFWGANFVLAIPILADLPPLWAAAFRFLLGALIMLVVAAWQKQPMLTLLKRHAGIYLLLGGIGIVGFNVLFFYALQSTSADNGALIMATNPLLTTLLASAFLGERPSLRHLLALPVALAGVAVVIAQGDMQRLLALHFALGDWLMLLADLAWAMFNVLNRQYMPKDNAFGNNAWMLTAGGLLLTIIAMFSGAHPAAMGAHASIAMAVMVVGGTVLAYLFWSIGIARLGASRAAIFLNLIPVFAMLTGAMLGEYPTAAQFTGGVIVLAGVLISMVQLPVLRKR